MGDTVKFIPEEDRCEFCGKESTLLCDMPRMTVVTSVDFTRRVLTCDKRICRECTTRVREFDFCPDCVNAVKSTQKGVVAE